MPVDLSLPPSLFRADLFYWLATVNKMVYKEHPDLIPHVLNLPGSCNWTFVNPAEGEYPNLLLARYDDAVVIGVHGTLGKLWLINAFLWAPQNPLWGGPGAVHPGWGFQAYDIAQLIKQNLPAVPAGQKIPILLTGHSLGGALAQMLAHLLKDHPGYQIKAVVTFGSPRAGNSNFAHANTWPVIRINNLLDPIPLVPPGWSSNWLRPVRTFIFDLFVAYDHAGSSWTLGADGSLTDHPTDFLIGFESKAVAAIVENPDLSAISAHGMADYLVRCRARLPRDITRTHRALPNLHQLDIVNANWFQKEQLNWTFPKSYPVLSEVSAGGALVYPKINLPRPHFCRSNPGDKCCQLARAQ